MSQRLTAMGLVSLSESGELDILRNEYVLGLLGASD
jgi:hypothetical protein